MTSRWIARPRATALLKHMDLPNRADRAILIWDADSGQLLRTLRDESSASWQTPPAVWSIAISSDGSLGAASGALTFTGGTLETTATFSLTHAINLGVAGGTISTDTGTSTISASFAAGRNRSGVAGERRRLELHGPDRARGIAPGDDTRQTGLSVVGLDGADGRQDRP